MGDNDAQGDWFYIKCSCPECEKLIIRLLNRSGNRQTATYVHPKVASRTPISSEVPEEYAVDYRESCLVLADSPKASAALSRRCLQALLRNIAQTKQNDLFDQIQEVMDANSMPSYLRDNLDAVRVIGNFAAHPIKSKQSGEIIEVETGEAEWNLDVLEGLFDFYFVQPQIALKKKQALNLKLEAAGKQLLP